MSADQPLTGDELATIKARAEAANWGASGYLPDRIAPAEVLRLVAEIERLQARQSRIDALFSGGPDTACRTTWYEVNPGNDHFCTSVECVEVPMADLREALAP